jgi:hypothetical protein
MAKIVTLVRFTAIPTHAVGSRLHFSALITPIVTSDEEQPKPIPVSEVPHLIKWHDYLPFPFRALPPGRLEVKVGAGPLHEAQGLKVETAWFDSVPHAGFDQTKAVELWQAIMQRARVQPESDKQIVGGEEVKRTSASAPRATELLQAKPGTDQKLVEKARDAVRKQIATLEGLGSASLSPIAANLVQGRLLDRPYPETSDQRRGLEELEFLLSRQERLGSAGPSNVARQQLAEDAAAKSTAAGSAGVLDSQREFHRLLSGFGDYPPLLRALGLLFDFSIDKTADLAGQFLISVRLNPLPGDVVAPAAPAPANTFELSPTHDAVANFEGATICALRETPAAFTPVPGTSTTLDSSATFFQGVRFDTVQWDLIATLRGAIREKNFVPPAGAVLAAGETPLRPAFIDLNSHGVSLFKTRSTGEVKDMPAEVKNALALARPGQLAQFGAAWTADDLTRGYRAEVRRRTGLVGKDATWSEWKSLSSREIVYQFKQGASAKPLFTVQDFAPLSLALAEGLQPLSGWIMQSAPLSPGTGPERYRIAIEQSELDLLGYARITAQPPVLVRTFLLQTHAGTVLVADVPTEEELEHWQKLNLPKAEEMDAARPMGTVEKELARLSPRRQPYLFGQYMDLQGRVAEAAGSEGNMFFAQQAQFPAADQGYGVAGPVAIGGLTNRFPPLVTPAPGATQPVQFVESVLTFHRRREPATLAALEKLAAAQQEDIVSHVHLRRPFVGTAQHPQADESDAPLPSKTYEEWLKLNGAGAQKGMAFIQGQGEFALSVTSAGDLHVANFFKPASSPGGVEDGEVRLRYTGPGPDGRSIFAVHEPEVSTEPNLFLPVSLDLTIGVPIQTLTNPKAAPNELTAQSIFRAALRRAADGGISVLALFEISPPVEATITGFPSADRLVLELPGAKSFTVRIDPLLTIVECTEAAAPVTPTAASGTGDSGFSGGEGEGSDTAGGGASFIRGPWAEQGLRLQLQDRCTVEIAPPEEKVSLRLANRITVASHARTRVLVGQFLDDAVLGQIGLPEDLQSEAVFAFEALPPGEPKDPSKKEEPPAKPPVARRFRLRLREGTRIVSGPGIPGQPWRYLQSPPVPGILTKVFIDADLPPATDSESKPVPLLDVAAVEVINGIEGTINLDLPGFTFDLRLPGLARLYPGRLGAELQKSLVRSQIGQLGEVKGNLRFLDSDIAGALEVKVEGFSLGKAVQLDSPPLKIDLDEEVDLSALAFRDKDNKPVIPPIKDELLQLSISWDSKKNANPKARALRIVRPLVRVQAISIDPATRRLETQVVFRQKSGTPLRPGARAALYLDAPDPTVVPPVPEPFAYLSPHLKFLIETGLPFDLQPQETMVVDDHGSGAVSSVPGPRQLHQWLLLAWPNTLVPPAPADQTIYNPTFIRGTDDTLVTVWARVLETRFLPHVEPVPTQPATSLLRMVAGKDPKTGQRVPLLGGVTGFALQKAPASKFPAGKDLDIHFLPDQLIIDDAIAHWTGGSLAVGLPGNGGLGSSEKIDRDESEPVQMKRKVPDRHGMPLRFGWYYEFRLRPVYLTGHCPDILSLDKKIAAIDAGRISFQPFSQELPPQSGNPAHLEMEAGTPAPVPFVRLEPIPPPRLGWPAAARANDSAKKHGWGTPDDLHLLAPTTEVAACRAFLSAEAAAATCSPKRDTPVLEVHPPESSFRLAELTGFLDELFHEAARAGSSFNEAAARQLYQELKSLDQPYTAGTQLGFVPPRLPDPDSDHCVLEVRPFGEKAVRITNFQLPCFYTSACLWLQNHKSPGHLAIRVVSRGLLPPAGTAQAIGGIYVVPEKGGLRIELPPNMDCELTLRSAPTPAALGRLAMARWLREAYRNASSDAMKGLIKEKWAALKEGFLPLLSPGLTVRLRHMTARPAGPPATVSLHMSERLPGFTKVVFDGLFRLDRPSTGALRFQAATEIACEDVPGTALPRVPRAELTRILPPEFHVNERPTSLGTAQRFYGFSSDNLQSLLSDEYTIAELSALNPSLTSAAGAGAAAPIPQAGGELEPVRFEHDLGDGRHHTVYYRPLAVSRFEQFYPEAERKLNPCPGPYVPPPDKAEPTDPDARIRWERVEIPATVRPHPPVIKDQNIVYDWQPHWGDARAWRASAGGWVFQRTRTAGVRLWLERPWYTSGRGETLAVLCWGKTRVRTGAVERYLRTVSRWGTDPVFELEMGTTTDMGVLTRRDFTHADPGSPVSLPVPRAASLQTGSAITVKNEGAVPVPPAQPVSPPQPAADAPDDALLALAVHQPKFHADERLWYCDIFVKPRRYTPFVSLSVARYQPYALSDHAVSESVRVDPMQIHPPRTLRLDAAVDGRLRLSVTLTGIFPPDPTEDRRLVLCSLEQYRGSLSVIEARSHAEFIELGWEPVTLPEEQTAPLDPSRADGKVQLPRPDRVAQDSVRRDLPGVPLKPSRRGREIVYELTLNIAPEADWSGDTLLRVVLTEHELYPSAYVFTEGRAWAPRLVYADSAVLPQQLVERLAGAAPVTLPPKPPAAKPPLPPVAKPTPVPPAAPGRPAPPAAKRPVPRPWHPVKTTPPRRTPAPKLPPGNGTGPDCPKPQNLPAQNPSS